MQRKLKGKNLLRSFSFHNVTGVDLLRMVLNNLFNQSLLGNANEQTIPISQQLVKSTIVGFQ